MNGFFLAAASFIAIHAIMVTIRSGSDTPNFYVFILPLCVAIEVYLHFQ